MVIIIGGGPAGMIAAISAASSENEVTLIEKNKYLGRKLLLTGGGRCNLTNFCEPADLPDHFSGTGDFLRDAFKVFDNNDLMSFLRSRGLETKIEDDGRVFPVTNKASSVLDLLEGEIKKLKINVLVNSSVDEIAVSGGAVKGVSYKDGTAIEAEKIVIATGGLSYSVTGATGDGIRMAEKLGHKIVKLRPGLVPVNLESGIPEKVEGISLDNVKLIFRSGKEKFTSRKGSVIFTKTGISGPVTLSASSRVVDWLDEGKAASLEIDVMPMVNPGELENILIKKIAASSTLEFKNVLKGFAPARFINAILELAGISPDKQANQLTSKERKELVALLKGIKFSVANTFSFEKAQITRGGVSTKEIDPKTMESKKIKGLYFAGEILDIDGDCGGFNLQAAFSTGYLAGKDHR